MMQWLLLACLLPAVHGRISVTVTVGKTDQDSKVEVYGHDSSIISDSDRKTFGIGNAALVRAVTRYAGATPTDVYVKSPTPWGDLYESYDWDQVTRLLQPTGARILSVSQEPTIVSRSEFKNEVSLPVKYKAGMSQNLERSTSHTWSQSNQIGVGQKIDYTFKFPAGEVGGSTSFDYAHSWGESTSESQTVTVSVSAGAEITLPPNATVVAELSASRGSLLLEVDYEAKLSGDVAVNYENYYKGHHFWPFEVNHVLRAADIPTTLTYSEKIEVGFYTDAKVTVKDYFSKETLLVRPAVITLDKKFLENSFISIPDRRVRNKQAEKQIAV